MGDTDHLRYGIVSTNINNLLRNS